MSARRDRSICTGQHPECSWPAGKIRTCERVCKLNLTCHLESCGEQSNLYVLVDSLCNFQKYLKVGEFSWPFQIGDPQPPDWVGEPVTNTFGGRPIRQPFIDSHGEPQIFSEKDGKDAILKRSPGNNSNCQFMSLGGSKNPSKVSNIRTINRGILGVS